MALAVRSDAGAALAADGGYIPLMTDSTGRLRVVTQGGAGGTSSVDDAAFTVATDSGTPSMGLFDDVSPDPVDEGDVGVLRMSGNRNLYAQLRDAAGNERGANVNASNQLEVSVGNNPVLGAGTNNIGDVDILSIAAGDNNIGNVDVLTLPALPAGTNNIGDVDVLSLPALPAGTNNIGDVDILSIAAGDNNIGNVDVVTLPALPAGTNNIGDVDILSIAAGDNNIGNVDIVSLPASTNTIEVVGDVAHDAAAAGNPVLISGRADTTEPTAVADADATYLLADVVGKLVTSPYATGGQAVQNTITLTSTTETDILAAAGVGIRNYVTSVSASNSSATAVLISFRDGTGSGNDVFSFYLAASGGGASHVMPFPIRGTANTAFRAALGAAVSSVYVSAQGYTSAV
jgi:hypothetical protein